MKVKDGPLSSSVVGDCRISIRSTPVQDESLLIVDDWKYSDDPHVRVNPGCGFTAIVSWEAMNCMSL